MANFFDKIGKDVGNFFQNLGKPAEERGIVTPGIVSAQPTPGTAGTFVIRPLDLILFNGKDPVAGFIRSIENKYVKTDDEDKPAAYWTHAGVIVDKTVLPLPELEDGKLYIYESIFTGSIAGYTYSKIFPVDIPDAIKKGNHAGPQLRPFVEVCDEANADIGICPMHDEDRARLFADLKELQAKVVDFHTTHKEYSYPFGIIPQLASANDGLAEWLSNVNKTFFKNDSEAEAREDRKAIFCSEMAALLYGILGVNGFDPSKAGLFSPVEIELTPAFTNICYWAKYEGKSTIMEDGKTLVILDVSVADAKKN
ncbi:hypothetical protein HK098_006565 [Nowakowskiella sp. JEL0407]|nr:hypothetical protein HK098_006565 [Nowakowskiella sp. JEL0407]